MKCLFCLVFSLLFWICMCQPRIGGGRNAQKGQFPFFAQIRRTVITSNGKFYWQCAGTLIQPNFLLTAAHCFPKDEEKRKYILAMNFVQTYMGSILKSNLLEPNPGAVENDIIEVFTHPYYDIIFPGDADETSGVLELGIQNDVAIAKLRRQYRLSPFLNLLPIPVRKNLKCKKGIIIGMGAATVSQWSVQLMYAKVKFLQHSELTDPSMYVPMNDTVFYVETKYLHGHVMSGDSGGAALCDFENGVVQRGIISTVHRNETADIWLDVYEDISNHLDFINSVVKRELRRIRFNQNNVKELHGKSSASSVTPPIFQHLNDLLKNVIFLLT